MRQKAHTFWATLCKKEWTAHETLLMEYEAPTDVPKPVPGQLVLLQIEKGVVRAYSVASSSEIWPRFRLLVKLIPGGRASEIYRRVGVGDELLFCGPLGTFCLAPSEKPMKMYATGTGVAPFLSYLEENVGKLMAPTTLHLGVWDASHLPIREALSELVKKHKGMLNIRIALDKADPEVLAKNTNWTQGYCTADLIAGEIDLEAHYALCGNPAMVQEAQKMLLEAGIERNAIQAERW